jgi:hypothetical protein
MRMMRAKGKPMAHRRRGCESILCLLISCDIYSLAENDTMVVFALALATSAVTARRAASVDPKQALRGE